MIEMLFLGACTATQAMFPIEVENIRWKGGFSYSMIKIENRSPCQIERIAFECTFFNSNETAIKLAKGHVKLLEPGQVGRYEVPARGEDLHSVSCRVTTVRDARP